MYPRAHTIRASLTFTTITLQSVTRRSILSVLFLQLIKLIHLLARIIFLPFLPRSFFRTPSFVPSNLVRVDLSHLFQFHALAFRVFYPD